VKPEEYGRTFLQSVEADTERLKGTGKAFGPELMFWSEGIQTVVGTDEAGRGPLAGPVVAAAVAFDPDIHIDGIGDSKVLSEKKRNLLFDEIQEKALAFSIVAKGPDVIDEINILQATRKAMDEAVKDVAGKLNAEWPVVLVDGRIPRLSIGRHINIIKGDSRSFCIGAASILAKVHRDRLMEEYDTQYPDYGFAKHKGYPTQQHRNAVVKYGTTPIHRLCFSIAVDENGTRKQLSEIKVK